MTNTMIMQWSQPPLDYSVSLNTPTVKNHSVTYYNGYLYCFGGYDGRRNHMTLTLFHIYRKIWQRIRTTTGTPPPGRNGHTATLVTTPTSAHIIIIGGWLGSGPLAASDVHVLDISGGIHDLVWLTPPEVRGTPPGPCNMHSADYVEGRGEVYVFRGGNGREYLNDLHALDVKTYTWRRVETSGEIPEVRANHSSSVLGSELFIFGGWNGDTRLNDLHILDTETGVWSKPRVGGIIPYPRAGMTLTALRDRLYLFGGSGASSKCFHDLQIFDRKEMRWLDVTVQEEYYSNSNKNKSSSPMNDDPMNTPSPMNHHPMNDMIDDYTTTTKCDWHQQPSSRNDQFSRGHDVVAANPNDEDISSTIVLCGRGPGRRAGHTATAVHNRFIYIFGGSCGSDYLSDFFILDTDPPPRATITTQINPLQLINSRLQYYFNEPEFSDVTFVVEGRKIYGHRMILSLVSDTFSAMFRTGFRESTMTEIEIPHVSYEAFCTVLEYIYRGRLPSNEEDLTKTVEVLELADQFLLDHLKQLCECRLACHVGRETLEYLSSVAQKTNAMQLERVCRHFERNIDFWGVLIDDEE